MNTARIVAGLLIISLCIAPSLSAVPNETDADAIDRAIAGMQAPEEVVALFQTEQNPNRRAEIVKGLDRIGRRFNVSMESLPPWGIAVLDRGLKDRHVYVCEWAVRKIGELKALSFESSLIALYGKIPARFNNSPTPMRRVIVEALGRLGGEESVSFLINMVENRGLSEMTDNAVKAMSSACDRRCIPPLRSHIEYWEDKLAEMERVDKEKAAKDTSGTMIPDSKRSYFKMQIRTSVDCAKKMREKIERGCPNE
jgi:hypothetical protein